MRPRPEVKVTGWIAAQAIDTLFLSVVTIGELESGFTTMHDSTRRARLEESLERHLRQLFPGWVLPVTRSRSRLPSDGASSTGRASRSGSPQYVGRHDRTSKATRIKTFRAVARRGLGTAAKRPSLLEGGAAETIPSVPPLTFSCPIKHSQVRVRPGTMTLGGLRMIVLVESHVV